MQHLDDNGYTAKDSGARFCKTTNSITALVSKSKNIFKLYWRFNSFMKNSNGNDMVSSSPKPRAVASSPTAPVK